ncbi:O-antigen ligase family protein, partial [Gottfriedia sp. NPDC056225]|uniref:O-antigen ligase family protein n=1 Tax=Gottfriedia sp. NPDC056225 TaxID=3345751 RepID=UPI0035D65B50
NYLRTINIIYKILSFNILLHVLLSGSSNILVLGIQTRFGDTYTIAIILLLVKMEISKKRLSFYDIVFIVFGSYFIFTKWISTMVLLDILLLLVYVISKSKVSMRWVNYYTLIPATILLNFSILFFRIQNVFKWLIVDFLHEDLTLDNRTLIWDNIFKDMSNHNIFLGSGILGENTRNIPIAIYNQYGYLLFGDLQAHNQLLSVLYWNGIMGLFLYLVIILFAGSKLTKCNRKVSMYFIAGTFLICLSMITELSANGNYFIIFVMCVYFCQPSNNHPEKVQSKGRRIVWSR